MASANGSGGDAVYRRLKQQLLQSIVAQRMYQTSVLNAFLADARRVNAKAYNPHKLNRVIIELKNEFFVELTDEERRQLVAAAESAASPASSPASGGLQPVRSMKAGKYASPVRSPSATTIRRNPATGATAAAGTKHQPSQSQQLRGSASAAALNGSPAAGESVPRKTHSPSSWFSASAAAASATAPAASAPAPAANGSDTKSKPAAGTANGATATAGAGAAASNGLATHYEGSTPTAAAAPARVFDRTHYVAHDQASDAKKQPVSNQKRPSFIAKTNAPLIPSAAAAGSTLQPPKRKKKDHLNSTRHTVGVGRRPKPTLITGAGAGYHVTPTPLSPVSPKRKSYPALERALTVMVTDMSGFTKLTRKYGTVHFAALIYKMREIMKPVLRRYAPFSLDAEADDLLVTFPSPLSAFSAAVDALYQVHTYNATIRDPDFRIAMSGCGLECSSGVVYDPESKRLFGPAFDRAFKIGEDMCEGGEILVGEEMYAVLIASPFAPFLSYAKRVCEEWTGTEPLNYYSVHYEIKNSDLMLKLLRLCANYQAPSDGTFQLSVHARSPRPKHINIAPAGADNKSGPRPSVAAGSANTNGSSVPAAPALAPSEVFAYLLKKRAEPNVDIAEIDREIHAQWTSKCSTAVLFSLVFDHVMHDAQRGVWQFQQLSKLVKEVVAKQFGGVVTEQWNLCAFNEPDKAVRAMNEFRERVRLHNEKHRNDPESCFKLNGIGAHCGPLTLVPGTDVHWGDCVNTAAKLADDVCTGGQVMLTDDVYQLLAAIPDGTAKLEFRALTFMRSGVELKCHEINPAAVLAVAAATEKALAAAKASEAAAAAAAEASAAIHHPDAIIVNAESGDGIGFHI